MSRILAIYWPVSYYRQYTRTSEKTHRNGVINNSEYSTIIRQMFERTDPSNQTENEATHMASRGLSPLAESTSSVRREEDQDEEPRRKKSRRDEGCNVVQIQDSHHHPSSTSIDPSAPQSPDARLPLIRSRQIRLPSANNPLTVRSHPPGIPVVPAFEVENCFFLNISFTIIKLIFFSF